MTLNAEETKGQGGNPHPCIRSGIVAVLLVVLTVLLAVLNLCTGSVSIPPSDVLSVLSGHAADEGVRDTWCYIVLESRLPQTVMALMGGAALAGSGLLLQTAFSNALAGPDVFGIGGGAALAVAIVMFVTDNTLQAGLLHVSGYIAVLSAAFVGAMAVTFLISFLSSVVRHRLVLLIVGIMTGYLANSAIVLLNFFATEEGVRSYMVWGMGSFANVSLHTLPMAAAGIGCGLVASLLLVKPLNALLLGEAYARSLGFSVRRVRLCLLLATGLLTATVTAFCGPVSFIGMATPHIARLLLSTDNHRSLLPATLLLGAVVALLCNLLCTLPSEHGVLPLGAITPLVGAPVIIYVLVAKR